MSHRSTGGGALVTGGASGIGLATAELLTERGAAVVLVDRDAQQVRRQAERLGATAVVADLADPAQAQDAVAQASDALGAAPARLAHCAGIYDVAPLEQLDADTWDRTLAINLRGAMLVGRALAHRLAGHPGSFVFISSMAARMADRTEPAAHYAASKAGLLGLVRQMAVEWAPAIRVNAVSPGVIDTPMLRLTENPATARAFLDDRVPLGRLGAALEVAHAITFLLSDAAAYITGAEVPVDGGVTIT
jgi:NAD(P)-dependent dehydrogenase (short-subunit alcohol dehydrogenase family)